MAFGVTQSNPWLRAITEGSVIVISILLAFGIDAWWDERQERRQEAEYLTAFLDEIDRNLSALRGNRHVLERSYSDLMKARDLLRSGSHVDSPGVFVMSLNRGLIYGVPSISTAVFDDLSNSGKIVLIEDLAMRRVISDLYAMVAAELVRFARNGEAALESLVDSHTPPGTISQIGPQFSFDESRVTAAEMLDAADALAAEESLTTALNAELRRRERERAFLDNYEQILRSAREVLATMISKTSS
jgi:hypothetical protein